MRSTSCFPFASPLPCWCSVVVSVESFSRSCRSASSLSSLSDLHALLLDGFAGFASHPSLFVASLFCARESGKLRFLLSHVWDLRESGGCKKICLRFPVLFLHSLSFFFPSQAEGKFIFSAVSANPICLLLHRPPRSLTSIAENVNRRKRIKMNFLHERRHRFPNFRAAPALSHDGV